MCHCVLILSSVFGRFWQPRGRHPLELILRHHCSMGGCKQHLQTYPLKCWNHISLSQIFDPFILTVGHIICIHLLLCDGSLPIEKVAPRSFGLFHGPFKLQRKKCVGHPKIDPGTTKQININFQACKTRYLPGFFEPSWPNLPCFWVQGTESLPMTGLLAIPLFSSVHQRDGPCGCWLDDQKMTPSKYWIMINRRHICMYIIIFIC